MDRDPGNCKYWRNGSCGICNSAIASSCEHFEYVPFLSDDDWFAIKNATTSIDSFNNRKPRFSDAPLSPSASPVSNSNKSNSKLLFEKLRSWRMMKSKQLGVPAFYIFHDSTLREIAELGPCPKSALLFVRGVGKRKYEQFADELYEIINAEQKEKT